MSENLIAFLGVAALVSLFLGFVVWWGRRAERKSGAAPNREATRAPQIRRRPSVISRPLTPATTSLADVLLARLLGTERTNAEAPVQQRSTQQDARSSVQERSAFSGVQGEILPTSREELQQLIAATEHKRSGKTKQEAIERAFGVKKGGSPAWKRASDLFDAATLPSTRYRAYTDEEKIYLAAPNGHE